MKIQESDLASFFNKIEFYVKKWTIASVCIRNGPADIAKKCLQLGKVKGQNSLKRRRQISFKKERKLKKKGRKTKGFFA